MCDSVRQHLRNYVCEKTWVALAMKGADLNSRGFETRSLKEHGLSRAASDRKIFAALPLGSAPDPEDIFVANYASAKQRGVKGVPPTVSASQSQIFRKMLTC
jgi:hypothetical protein